MWRRHTSSVLVILLVFLVIVVALTGKSPVSPVTEEYLHEVLDGGRVKKVRVAHNDDGSSTFTADLHGGRKIAVTERDDRPLRRRLAEEGVAVEETERTALVEFLAELAPWLIVFVVVFLFLKRAEVRVDIRHEPTIVRLDQASPKLTLHDVYGLEGPVAELRAIVRCLRQPPSQSPGVVRPIRGCLLTGPTGTGKTLLVRALAGETGLPVLSSPTAEFIEVFVGLGAARLRRLMEAAAKLAPAIVFLDDVDGIARRRMAEQGVHQDTEREHALHQLFQSIDRLNSDGTRVLLLVATNRPDLLDEGLLRPGRIDRIVELGAPDPASRQAILRGHLSRRGVEGIDVDALVARTEGWVGADLEGVAEHLSGARPQGGAPKATVPSTLTREDVESALESIGRVRRARATAATTSPAPSPAPP